MKWVVTEGPRRHNSSMNDRLFRAVIGAQASALVSPGIRRSLLRATGIHVADDAVLFSGSFFGSSLAFVGPRCFISIGCFLDGSAQITLSADVHLAPGVRILTSTHDIGPPNRRAGELRCLPVTIGDGAWVGAGCTLMPGVTVASGCVIGAGSLVVKNTTPDTIWLGRPAREVRRLDIGDA